MLGVGFDAFLVDLVPSYIARSPSSRRCDNSTISSPTEHANSFCVMITGNRCFQQGRIRVVFLQAVEGPTFVYAYGLPFLSDDVQVWGMRNAEAQRGHI